MRQRWYRGARLKQRIMSEGRSRLIDKYRAFQIEIEQLLEPGLVRRHHIRTALLTRVRRPSFA